MMRSLAIFSLVLVTAAAGCNGCEDIETNTSSSELDIDKAKTGLDFGMVRIRESKTLKLVMFNRGRSSLKILGIDRQDVAASFLVAQAPTNIAPDATSELTITFRPDETGAADGTIVVRTDSQITPEVSVQLRGEGVETKVTVSPETMDFGLVEVQSRVSENLVVKNEGLITEDVRITPATDSPHFSVGPIPGEGDVVRLEPGATALIPVTFAPQFADRSGFLSTVEVLPCENCEPSVVTLKGAGIEAFLDVQPKTCLDFGLVNPGAELTKDVTVTNLGGRPLTVLEAAVADGATYTLAGTFPATVAANETLKIPVTYKPTALRRDTGRVLLATDDPKAAAVEVCLEGSGGGPDVSLQPARVDFGTVAVGTTRTKPLRINNAGLSQQGSGVTLVITKAYLRGADSRFSTAFTQPIEIDLGMSATLDVTYAPTTEAQDGDTLVLETNDTDSPTLEVPLTGKSRALPPCQLQVTPTNGALAFGNVERGREVGLNFALKNQGTADCIIDSMEVTGTSDPAFRLGAAAAEDILTPGTTKSYTVFFKPLEARSFAGRAQFNVSDPANPVQGFDLTGTSVKGCLLIAPSDVDFGTVGSNCASREKQINVYNTCGTAVKVQGVTLAEAPVQVFEAFGLPATYPVNLTGSTNLAFRLRFRPNENGNHFGGVYLKTDERPEPYLISLVGRAADDAIQHDVFLQENKPKVDLLFVVDNSGSMGDEQQALAQNFAAFMKFANQQQVDYHIAITTTDVDSNGQRGKFVGNPSVLTPQTPNVASVFATNINVGTNGSASEKGHEGAYLALTAPNINGPNANFLRDDARLSVIIVSDETDQSDRDLNFYYNFYLSIKGARRANLFSLSAVVEPPPTGDRYIEIARRTGGIVTDIGTSDWAKDLERLGAIAFGYKTRFFLTSTPAVAQDISVRIDGNDVPQREGTITNWTYDPQSNSIDFNLVAVPEPGSTLTVDYVVACGQ